MKLSWETEAIQLHVSLEGRGREVGGSLMKKKFVFFEKCEGILKASHANEGIHAGDLKLQPSYSNWRKDAIWAWSVEHVFFENLKGCWRHHIQMKGSMQVIWSCSPVTVIKWRHDVIETEVLSMFFSRSWKDFEDITCKWRDPCRWFEVAVQLQ